MPGPGGPAADLPQPACPSRPASCLAREAATFASTIRIGHGGKSVNPTGVLAVMRLGATIGRTVTVHAVGQDTDSAVKTLAAILAEAEWAGY